MHHKSLGFIGGGRITGILLAAWERQGKQPEQVFVSDPDEAALHRIQSRFDRVTTAISDNRAAAGRDIVFLAVHPPAIVAVAAEIRDHLQRDAILVSLAPKVTTTKLAELLGGFGRIARTIPNAPSIVGNGYNPVSFASELTAGDREEILALLRPLGECPEVAESKLEAYAVLTAMGPTYLWFQLQTLREIAREQGLGEQEACHGLLHMVEGAARTLLDSGLSPVEVLDLIPVKPLAEMEPQVTDLYRSRLAGVFQKIKP